MYKKRKYRTIIVIVLETVKSRIVFSVFRVVTSHCLSRTKNKYAKAKFSGQRRATYIQSLMQ